MTREGWYTLANVMHHAAADVGWPFASLVKDVALGHKPASAL